MQGGHLEMKRIVKRPLLDEERSWLDLLLGPGILGRGILRDQLDEAKVAGVCSCGCKSILIDVDRSKGKARYPFRHTIPVELDLRDGEGRPLALRLYIMNGYLSRLEVESGAGADGRGMVISVG